MKRFTLLTVLALSVTLLLAAWTGLDRMSMTASKKEMIQKVELLTQKEKHKGKIKTEKTLKAYATSVVKIKAASVQAILEEDFSKFVAGTEPTPDATDITDPQTGEIPASFTHEAGWYGAGIHQAGGSCALKLFNNNGAQETGFIETPQGNLAGQKITVSFRARSFNSAGDTFACLLIDGELGDLADGYEIQATNQWDTYTIEFDGLASCWLQIYPYEFEGLIDDVVITGGTVAPTSPLALPATDYNGTSFTANWEEFTGATSYLLNVYTLSAGTTPITVTEGFDGLSVAVGDKKLNTEPNYPAGWKIDVTTNGTSRHVYASAGNFSSAKYSLAFDATGDYITTPLQTTPITGLSLWVKNQTGDKTSSIKIESFNGSSWTTFTTLIPVDVDAKGAVVSFTTEIPADALQIRMTYTKGVGNVSIDDVSFIVGGTTREYVLQDQEVTGLSYQVSGLDANKVYYYTVKAKTAEGTTAESNVMEVEEEPITSLDTPTGLNGENMKDDSFTALWSPVEFATGYVYYVVKNHMAAADELYTLLDENFDGIKEGTVENPIKPEELYMYLDQYTQYPDWTAVSPLLAQGMIGADNSLIEYGLPGSITTPILDLSNNNGSFSVTIKAQTLIGDSIYIMAVDAETEMGYAKAIRVTASGVQEYQVTFSNGTKATFIDIQSNTKKSIFVDHLTVRQNLKQGEFTAVNCQYGEVENPTVAITIGNDFKKDAYGFMVAAYGIVGDANGDGVTDANDIIVSDYSDVFWVYVPSAVESVEASKYQVYTLNNTVRVEMDQDADIMIYNTAGSLIQSFKGTAGSHSFELATNALYVIKIGNAAYKVQL